MKTLETRLSQNGFLTITDEGEFSTAATLKLNVPITFDKESFEEYRKDARAFLDKESKRFNRLGINRFIAALLVEVVIVLFWGGFAL